MIRFTRPLLLMLAMLAWGTSLPSLGVKLAIELFGEADWANCRLECRRELMANPNRIEAQVLLEVCSLRMDISAETSLEKLKMIAADSAVAMNMRTLAAYEAGRADWQAGDLSAAYDSFAFAYLNTVSEDLFLRTGCSIFLLMRADKSLRARSDSLSAQIKSSRALYDWSLQQECMPSAERKSTLLGKPGEWVVALYRGQIAPAIGMRCSCVPSCSEYFRQACRKHGLLGFALQADRFFREPSVVQQRLNPVVIGDQIRYADPLSDHDYWLK